MKFSLISNANFLPSTECFSHIYEGALRIIYKGSGSNFGVSNPEKVTQTLFTTRIIPTPDRDIQNGT